MTSESLIWRRKCVEITQQGGFRMLPDNMCCWKAFKQYKSKSKIYIHLCLKSPVTMFSDKAKKKKSTDEGFYFVITMPFQSTPKIRRIKKPDFFSYQEEILLHLT